MRAPAFAVAFSIVVPAATAQDPTFQRVFDSDTRLADGTTISGMGFGTHRYVNGAWAGWGKNGASQVVWRHKDGVLEVMAGHEPDIGAIGFAVVFFDGDASLFGALIEGPQAFPHSIVNGRVTLLAKNDDPLPGGVGIFEGPVGFAIGDGHVLVANRENGLLYSGFYLTPDDHADFSTVVDLTTIVPGTDQPFDRFLVPDMLDGRIVFWGGFDRESSGLFSCENGAVEQIAFIGDAPPDGPPIDSFGGLLLDLTTKSVAFHAYQVIDAEYFESIYLLTDACDLSLIADTSTDLPGTGATAEDFMAISCNGDDVAFLASLSDGSSALYASAGGKLIHLLSTGDLLDGELVTDIALGRDSYENDKLSIGVEFESGLEAIYLVTIPSTCPADFNADGNLDILDFVAFQSLFLAQDPAADCNADGALNILDFVCFQQLFQAGCP
jgi:hypothetical protein